MAVTCACNYFPLDAGNLGLSVGTTAPKLEVHIMGPGQATAVVDPRVAGATLAVQDNFANPGNGGVLLLGANQNNPDPNIVGLFAGLKGVTTGADGGGLSGALTISTRQPAGGPTLSERLRVTADGLVGIGTAAPQRALHLAGPSVGLSIQDTSAGGHRHTLTTYSPGDGSIGLWDETVSQFRWLATANGRLGVGSNTPPAYALDVSGDARATGRLLAGTGLGIGTTAPQRTAHLVGPSAGLAVEDATAGGHRYSLTTLSPGSGTFGLYDDTVNQFRWLVAASGLVMIGPGTPAYMLDVGGDARARGNLLAGGNVGAGTTAPTTRLAVVGGEANSTPGQGSAAALRIVNTDLGAVGRLAELQFGVSTATRYAAISGAVTDGGNNTAGELVISTRGGSADANLTERLRFRTDGGIQSTGSITAGTSSSPKSFWVGNTKVADSRGPLYA